ncbi:MAG: dTDP-4-dehydrorhamnose reductase [Clostridiales bacterium]|jgi:dTDP-4-dehydrorhamnose reductase|nr:dTDP-4-dehydrorhamnose reductase [Eubacteriales bacterium]MDH7566513.1 dTDP-4-dehydrorhamnose reductase [Clostridiales bacterium]
MRKILLTGCRGQLGKEISRQLNQRNGEYEVVETDVHSLDITDRDQVFRLVSEQKPQVIINCAAYTNVDACEGNEAEAFKINATGAQNLSTAACNIGAEIVQISTDYVFDGEGRSPRREYDAINPQSSYGRSKALGEQLVREANPRHFILRTAWLYGDGNNFVRTMLRLAGDKKVLHVVNDQVGTPTSTVDLAKCILNLIHARSYGTYHATCEGECSWYEFSKKIFEIKKIRAEVRPITTEQLNRPAKRPKYSVLDNYMLKQLHLNTFRNWEDSLEEYLKGEVTA